MKFSSTTLLFATSLAGVDAFTTQQTVFGTRHVAVGMSSPEEEVPVATEQPVESQVPPAPKLPAKSQSLPFMDRPAALDGSLVGDVGFDPLGFAKNSEDLLNYREAEIKHGRLAMLVRTDILLFIILYVFSLCA